MQLILMRFCRFEVEARVPILYVYEVQLEQRIQQKGLGTFLMTFLKLYAKKNHLERIMLTVMDVSLIQSCCSLPGHPYVQCFEVSHSVAGKYSCCQNVYKAWIQARCIIPIPGRPYWSFGRPYRL